MDVFRRVTVLGHGRLLELLLILSVLLLVAQLGWPNISYWWHLPSPGTIGFDRFESDALAEQFLIYLPQQYGEDKLWPLVAFLHGSGKRGNDPSVLCDCSPLHERLPAIVAAPQCLPSHSWEPDAVAKFVQHVASTYHVDRQRIYLVGYSMGGYGTWHTAAAYPKMFAAVVPICGGGKPDDAKALAEIPVWAFHGAEDEVIPLATSELMIQAIRDAGGQPRLSVLPEAGHGICDAVCGREDVWEWLLAQRRERPANER